MKRIFCLIFFLAFVFIAAGCGDGGGDEDEKGACKWNSGLSCGDNYTQSDCNFIKGTFYKGKTCKEV